MTDEIEKEEEISLTAEYVLGLLSEDETAAYEEVLTVDPDLRDEYAFWADRMVALTDDIAAITPPPHLLARIKETLFHDPTPQHRGASTGPSWLRRLGLLPAMAGGLIAAVAVLWIVSAIVPPAEDAPGAIPAYVEQIAADDASLVVRASYDPSTQALTVSRETGAARDGRALELWLIAGDNPPLSLGVLPDDTTGTIPVDASVAGALLGGTLAITDEPAGGSASGAPTGEVLATGQVTEA